MAHRGNWSEASETGAELERPREALRDLERRFRSIIERTADGILVIGEDGTIRFANAAATELFGRSRDELVGAPFGHPVVVGERAEIDLVGSGRSIVAELRATTTEWDDDPATIVSVRDITDRKRAEEQARRLLTEQVARAQAEEAAARSDFLSEASRRLFSSLDPETTLQTVVSLAADGFADFCVLDTLVDDEVRRYTATVATGARAERLREAEAYPLDPEADTPQARVFRTGEPLLVREVTDAWLRAATRDEEHLRLARALGVTSLVCVPLSIGQRSLGVFMAVRWREERFGERDLQLAAELGRRAALAIENARLYDEAQAGNRAKANFLSVISHELRTPLSAIIGYADLMDRQIAGPTTDRQRQFLGRIRSSSNHLLQIIEEVLAFASAEAGAEKVRVEEFTLRELLDDVLALAEPMGRDGGLPLRIELEDGDTTLATDGRKLRQILLNLVSNAFKFTTEGEVRIVARVEGDQAVVAVSDTGVGIPPERHESIFEQFWQAEDPMTRRAGGTGLGLAVARAFARLLGGDIIVESVPGEGSTFTVLIPLRYEG